MNLDACKNTVKAGHVLWFKIKDLHIILEFAVTNVDFDDSNDNNSVFWDLIVTKIEDFFSYITSESTIVNIMSQTNNNVDRKREIWNNYELLIDKLFKLALSREYKIIHNYEEFIDGINILFVYLENTLKESILKGEIYSF